MGDAADKRMIIPTGMLFSCSVGEYSDYLILGVFRATADIDCNKLRDDYLRDRPEQAREYSFKEHEFLAWLTRQGLLTPVDCMDWHLSEYGHASRMSLTDPHEIG